MSEILEKATGIVQAVPSGTVGTAGEVGAAAYNTTTGLSGTSAISNNSGGMLLPTQSRQFIDYIFDQMVLAKDGRRVVMQANTMELDKIQVGSRMVRKANQAGIGTYTASVTNVSQPAYPYADNLGDTMFTKIEVTTTKFRLDYELSTEALEDNIEGAGLEDHIARLMAVQFGNDLEDIAINGLAASGGNYTGNDYPYTLDGFIQLTKAGRYGDANFGAASVSNATASPFITSTGLGATAGSAITAIETLYNALPRKFQQRRNELKIYANTKNVQTLLTDLRKVGYGSALGNATEPIATEVLNGGRPRVGGPAGYTMSVFGIPILEVPLYPANFVDMTFPTNRIWGFQRDITVHREFKPKKDTVEYTVYVRLGVGLEESSAISYMTA